MLARKKFTRQLNITVVGVQGLRPGKKDGDRNVQIRLQVEDLHASTRFISKTLSPEFDQTFAVVMSVDAPPLLICEVVHKDEPNNPECKEESLGVAKVKLGLMENRPIRDVKYNLEKKVIWAEEEAMGELRLQIEYTSEITIDPEETLFKKLDKAPAKGNLLEYQMKEIEKLRSEEKELGQQVQKSKERAERLEQDKQKLVYITSRLEQGEEVLSKLTELDTERTALEAKYKRLCAELEEKESLLSRKDKQIMQLEKMATQNRQLAHKMTVHSIQRVSSEKVERPAADENDMGQALDELHRQLGSAAADDAAADMDSLLQKGGSMSLKKSDDEEDDAESEDEDEEGGQADDGETPAEKSTEADGKWKKRFEKEKVAKNEWKSKYLDMESLYNEIVLHRQQQQLEPSTKDTSKTSQKSMEEIAQLKEELVLAREANDQLKMEIKLTEGQLDDAMKKYRKEAKERKKLYNEIQELKGNIRVYCRCRPISNAEMTRGATDATTFGDLDDITIFCENGQKKSFEFDRTFDQDSTQEKVFEDTLPLMQSVLDGFNVCIFAYGQTGSGKTFTMQGSIQNPGVNLRALTNLFQLVADKGDDYLFEMGISIFEIYCDTIRDLLETSRGALNIRQEKRGTRVHNYVDGLSQRVVASVDDVINTIKLANDNRSTASTNMNEYSSRSHLIMTVDVATIDKLSDKRTQSALHMIDLAGSERVGRSGVQGQALKEAQFINQSLAALGNTLSALGRKDNHVPYRDSKLTHALADALGGNSKVLMFCNVSPSSDNVQETLSSLQFATRARAVELGKATANVSKGDNVPAELIDDEEEAPKPKATAPAITAPAKTASSSRLTTPARGTGKSTPAATAAAPAAAPSRSPRASLTTSSTATAVAARRTVGLRK